MLYLVFFLFVFLEVFKEYNKRIIVLVVDVDLEVLGLIYWDKLEK